MLSESPCRGKPGDQAAERPIDGAPAASSVSGPTEIAQPVSGQANAAAQLCALAALSIGLVASTGWLTYWLVLTTFGAASIPMAPSTALAFLVLGGAAFALARWPVSRLGHCFAVAAALLVSVAASLAVAEFLAGVDLGLEQLVAQPSGTFMGYQGALMSPVTAACFVLAGLAVLSLSARPGQRWAVHDVAAGLAMIVMAVGSIVTMGYLFGAPLLYGGAIRPVALPTGLAFVALSASILVLAGPHARMLSPLCGSSVRARLLRALLPTVAAAVLVTAWLEVSLVQPRHANLALWSALATTASMLVTASVVGLVAAGIGSAIERAEAARRAAEEVTRKLSRAVEQSPATVVITDRLGKIEYVNPKFTRLTGYTFEEALGQNPRILKSGRTPPETYKQLWAAITAGGTWRGEFVNKKKSGEFYWEDASISPIVDADGQITHFLAVKEDITDRKRAEEALRASETLNRAILEAAVDGIVMIDDQGIIRSCNAAAERLFGYPAAELLGQDAIVLMPPEHRGAHKAGMARYLLTGEGKVVGATTEMSGVRQDGTVFPLAVTIGELRLDAQRAFVGVLHDLTERKRAETVREGLIAQLEEKNAELERLTYTVSHDLKSPLVTIQGFLAFLEKSAERGDLDQVRAHAARITGAANHMKDLVENLLDLSRAGRAAARQERVPMGALAQEAVQINAGAIAARRVQVEIAPDLPEVRGDRQRLLQVWGNLVGNAVKFTGNQAEPRIQLGLRHDGAEVVYFVRDNGMGIDPRFANDVFDVFRKLDARAEGSGIGLAIVKRIVELHGGRIWVESEGLGKGTTFCFTLPEAAHAS